MNFTGQHVLLTGASSGLGRELAVVLSDRGAVLTLSGRDPHRLQETATALHQRAPKSPAPTLLPADLAIPAQASGLVQQARQVRGGLDVLINNAGMGAYGEVRRMSARHYEQQVQVNLLAAIRLTLTALPHFERQGSGLVVNMASAAALHGVPYLSGYSASKAGLVAFSQSLRAELSDSRVRVALVYPGYLQTGFFAHEEKVGGARRPEGPYLAPEIAARRIVAALERDRLDIHIGRDAAMLRLAVRISPWLVGRIMCRLARRLTTKAEIPSHQQPKAAVDQVGATLLQQPPPPTLPPGQPTLVRGPKTASLIP